MKTTITIAALVILAVTALVFLRRAGYRGAIGFKTRHSSEIATIQLTGFSKPIDCRTLAHGEHSFNYLGRQDIPDQVQIAWRLVGDTADRTATISLSSVPKDAKDGELFLYAPQLQLDTLQKHE